MTTITTAATPARKPLYTSLFVQVLTALLLGIVLGMAVPDFAIGLKILSATAKSGAAMPSTIPSRSATSTWTKREV